MLFYESDAKRIMNLPTKSERKLAFLLTVFIDAYGSCAMSHARLAAMIGVRSKATIEAGVKDLVERGLFAKKQGMVFFAGDGGRSYIPNRYSFPAGYMRGGGSIAIGKLTPENFDETFTHATIMYGGLLD